MRSSNNKCPSIADIFVAELLRDSNALVLIIPKNLTIQKTLLDVVLLVSSILDPQFIDPLTHDVLVSQE